MDVSRAIEFTSSIFSAAEPTSVALGITAEEFSYVFDDVMRKSVEGGLSFSEKNAVILSIPYDDFLRVKYNVISKIEPMFSLFDTLEYKYKPDNADTCLYVFSIASSSRDGSASRMLQRMIAEATCLGFSSVLADCTNSRSQRLFERVGFATRASTQYDSFTYAGIKPFETILCTDDIFRMEYVIEK